MNSVDALADYLGGPLILFVLVLTRMGVMIMAMPAIADGVPMRVRALLAIALTMLVLPLIEPADSLDIHSLMELVIAAVREAGIGMLIGLIIRMLVSGLQIVGELASSGGGLQMGQAADPFTQSTISTLGRLVGLLVTAVMITLGGHRMMIEALMDSFRSMPPGDIRFEIGMLELVVFELGNGIATGIRAGAPIVAALLLSNLITGLISRTLPQLNILAIGLPLNALVLLAVASMTIGAAAWLFQDQMLESFARLEAIW